MKIESAISSIFSRTNYSRPKPPEENQNNQKVPEQASTVTTPLGMTDVPIHHWTKADRLLSVYTKVSDATAVELLQDNEIMPEEAYKFLSAITKDDETSTRFINEIIKDENGDFDPKKSPEIVKILVNKLGGKENFEKWYFDNDGYLKAFSKYAKKYLEEAETVEDLYAFSPAWGVWEVRKKFRTSMEKQGKPIVEERIVHEKYHDDIYTDGYTVGELPPEFESVEKYREFVEEVRFTMQRDLDINECAKKYGFKGAQVLDRGCSGKFNLKLDDKYVIKMSNYRNRNVASGYFNELIDMTPDSVFLNSMVDYYTNRYAPNKASKMYFYDDLTNSAVYEFEKGKSVRFETDEAEINTRSDYFKKLFKEVEDIGITYTDYNGNNYIETEDGIKCIDSGHAVYSDLLKPQVGGKMISLPCRTGLNPLELEGRLSSIIN